MLPYETGAGCYCGTVDDVFKLTLSLDGAAVFHSAVDIRVQQSFVASVDDGLNIRGITIRNFEGFSVEYFAVGVVGANILFMSSMNLVPILVLTN